MIILSLRTDKPDAEVGLFDGERQLAYVAWHADRQLSVTLLRTIADMLEQHGKSWPDIQGIVAFQGPGSFTGLRIGLTVANTLAYGLSVPVVARQDPQWLQRGIGDILAGVSDRIVLPEYGAPVHTTEQKR